MGSDDLDKLVRGLTAAQKRAIVQAKSDRRGVLLWLDTARSATIASLFARGIADDKQRPAFLTPLGLAIKAHIERTTMPNNPDLAALSEAATQERQDREYYSGGLNIGAAVPRFHAALEAAYRSGDLVLIPGGREAMRERVAVIVEQSMWSPASGPVTWSDDKIVAMKEQAKRVADAIAAMLGEK